MLKIRITCLVLCFLLIIGIRLVNLPIESGGWVHTDLTTSSLPDQHSEVQNPFQHFYFAIEVNNFYHTISEVHRLLIVMRLSNQIVPLNCDFRRSVFIPVTYNYNSPVSIFIKGHALLN